MRTALAEAIAVALVLAVIAMAVSTRAQTLRCSDAMRVREATALGLRPLRVHARTLVAECGVLVTSVGVAAAVSLALGAASAPALLAASVLACATSGAVVGAVVRNAGVGGDADAT